MTFVSWMPISLFITRSYLLYVLFSQDPGHAFEIVQVTDHEEAGFWKGVEMNFIASVHSDTIPKPNQSLRIDSQSRPQLDVPGFESAGRSA